MTTSALVRGGPEPTTYTRYTIIERLQRYHALYGVCTAACFSPSAAKNAGRADLVERYYLGDPDTGQPWPSLNTIKSRFNDSFAEATREAGLPASKRGPARRKPGEAVPIRESHVGATRLVYIEKRGTSDLERELERARVRADRAERALAELRAKPRVRKVTNTAVLAKARERAKEARDKATREAALRERAEATINTLRAKRREDAEVIKRLERRLAATANDVREVIVKVPVEKVVRVTKVVERAAPGEAVIEAAHAKAREAAAAERAAVRDAEDAREAYLELAEAVAGARRKLTADELAEMRTTGPAGPAVFVGALKALAKARKAGGRDRQAIALLEVARAAMGWRDRL